MWRSVLLGILVLMIISWVICILYSAKQNMYSHELAGYNYETTNPHLRKVQCADPRMYRMLRETAHPCPIQ